MYQINTNKICNRNSSFLLLQRTNCLAKLTQKWKNFFSCCDRCNQSLLCIYKKFIIYYMTNRLVAVALSFAASV